MVEVFKTNIEKKTQSKMLLRVLTDAFPSSKISFDLSDCDRVLRVEDDRVEATSVMWLVKESGFTCEVLD
ncbi:MAG: hypothetical protein AB7K37_16530 [Cyclobacteriaceae bacterium]